MDGNGGCGGGMVYGSVSVDLHFVQPCMVCVLVVFCVLIMCGGWWCLSRSAVNTTLRGWYLYSDVFR